MKKMQFIVLILMIVVPLFLTNCKKSAQTKKGKEAASKAKDKDNAEKKEEDVDPFKQEEDELFKGDGYKYVPGKRRDPFNPLIIVQKKAKAQKKKKQ